MIKAVKIIFLKGKAECTSMYIDWQKSARLYGVCLEGSRAGSGKRR
jgi:hypothetical protein